MLDGRIVDEKRLGKYSENGSGSKIREEQLSRWLLEMGL
jgi:hypothetical protein